MNYYFVYYLLFTICAFIGIDPYSDRTTPNCTTYFGYQIIVGAIINGGQFRAQFSAFCYGIGPVSVCTACAGNIILKIPATAIGVPTT